MKFGIIGAGMIARFHAQAINAMEEGTLHSVYARDAAKAESFAEEFGCKAYTDFETFLADQELEVVTIATPSGAHLEPALAAAKAGKHIACEKPLEVTTERVDEMIAAADAHGVKLAGIFNRRFSPAVAAIKQAAEQKRFGTLALAEASIKWYRDQAYYDSGAWRGTWKLDGGGALMNQGIHTVDQLIYIAGPIKRLSASMATLAHEGIEVEDTAVAVLEFENGARGVIQASTACFSKTGHPAEVQLCGDQGSAFLTDESFRVWDFAEEQEEDAEILSTLMQGADQGLGANDPTAINFYGHQRTFEDLVTAIQNDTVPAVDGHEARKAVAVIRAIYESAQNGGKWVEL
ncbi:myo-inositol 2-dehydrogenase [Rubritalea halochordaticola]|uniref:Myo-inositol 2-dehydrogenase n=1 Tax=Rubritalea halochordaticola TaxID=714537 RepID=A0ABP9V610_9BACT